MIVAKMIWDAVFGNAVGRIIAACLAGLVALKAYGWTQQGVGAAKVVAKIEKANKHAVEKGKRAADRSVDPRVRGLVDPTTRD
jgi:uncharacterized Ntn-hydrolase superfamily protein